MADDELVECPLCKTIISECVDCPCLLPRIQLESAERIRHLMSLGHPCECGEHYSRWMIMDECKRRGKLLFLDLGWPIEQDSIYKNKYTGSEHTLRQEVYNYCMDRELNETFDERLKKYCWSVIEHAWPKDKWVDSEMFDEYKGKLSNPAWSDYNHDIQDDTDDDVHIDDDEIVDDEPVSKDTQTKLFGV